MTTPNLSATDRTRLALWKAAIDLLAYRGLSGSVSIDEAADRAGIGRSTAYRAYTGRSAAERFRVDVLCHIAETLSAGTEAELEATVIAVAAVLDEIGPLDRLSTEQREHALIRVICTGGDVNLEEISNDNQWHLYATLIAESLSEGVQSEQMRSSLQVGTKLASERYGELYRMMADLFGMVMKPQYTFEQLGALAGALAEGIATRRPYLADGGVMRPGYPGVDECSMFSIGFLGLVREFFEPITPPKPKRLRRPPA